MKREKHRDDREYDTTQLHEAGHGRILHRDYSAHFFRWSFARRFITSRDTVLEIGCGQDKPLSKILTGGVGPHVKSYVGVDLNYVKPSESQRLTFMGEFNFIEQYKELKKHIPPKSGGFDVIVHMEVIEHMKVEHGTKLLRHCYELLRPGGTMLMSTPRYDGKRHAANHIHEYTVPELQKAVEKAGFVVTKRFGTFTDVKVIGKAPTGSPSLNDAIRRLRPEMEKYFDSDAISNFFVCLYPDHARNNLWVTTKPREG